MNKIEYAIDLNDGFLNKAKNQAVKTVSVENITGKSFILHGIKTFHGNGRRNQRKL